MYGTNANSSTLAGSAVTMLNRSSTSAAQKLLGTYEIADSMTRLFFNVFLAPSLTVTKIRWSRIGYIQDSAMQ